MARTFTSLGTQRLLTPATGRYAFKAYSIALRILPTSTAASDTIPLGNGDTSGGFYVRIPGATLNIALNSSFATSAASQSGNTALTQGAWSHWVGTCSDMTALSPIFSFYLNGVADSLGTLIAGVGAYVAPNIGLSIGNQNGGGSAQGVGGSMESVGIWSRVLTATEALGLANGLPPDAFPQGLVSHFPLAAIGGPVADLQPTGLVATETGSIPARISNWSASPLAAFQQRSRYAKLTAAPVGYPAALFFGIPNRMPQPSVRAY